MNDSEEPSQNRVGTSKRKRTKKFRKRVWGKQVQPPSEERGLRLDAVVKQPKGFPSVPLTFRQRCSQLDSEQVHSRCLFFFCCILLSCAPNLSADESTPFRFYKEVQFDPIEREEMIAATLDSDVFEATRDDLPDVRLNDAEDREVPYLLEKATETRSVTIRKTWHGKGFHLQPVQPDGVEITFELKEDDPSADGITLHTPLKNYQQRLSVFGSDDGMTWEPLVSEALIFDYSQYMDVRSEEVPLPKNTFRSFRIVIDDVNSEQESDLQELTRRLRGGQETERFERIVIKRRPFRIDRIEFWSEEIRERPEDAKKAEYPIADFQVEEDTEEQQTIVLVQTRREPLTALILQTPSRNFSRRAIVRVPVVRGIRTQWHDVGRTTIKRITFRDLQQEELKIPFAEQRCRQYRFVIENRDSPPQEITGLLGEGNIYRIVFLANPGATYRIVYGSESAQSPSYDTAAIRESLKSGYHPIEASLGGQIENTKATGPPTFSLTAILNNPLFLGGVILILVIVLSWGLYTAGRRIDSLPKQ